MRSVWRETEPGEERGEGAEQTYFNNAKNNHVNIPFCSGSRRSLGTAGESLAWTRGSCLPDRGSPGCLWVLGMGFTSGISRSSSVQWRRYLFLCLPPSESQTWGNLSLNRWTN